jgi:GNAT superfamily N-acetyltransferase
MLTIEPLSPHLVKTLRTVRLRALQDALTAFGGSYATESQFSEDDWLARTSAWNSGNSSVCYIAMDGSLPCGIIGGFLDERFLNEHFLNERDPPRPTVGSMWVAPEHRSAGLGTRLMNEVERWARGLGTGELWLMVTSGNEPAIRFYRRCGFEFTGATEPYKNDPALFQYEMVKFLRRT